MEEGARAEAVQLGCHRAYRWPIRDGWRLLCWPYKVDIEKRCIDAYRLGYYDWNGLIRELRDLNIGAKAMRDVLSSAQENISHELPSNITFQHYLLYTGQEIALDEAMEKVRLFIESVLPA